MAADPVLAMRKQTLAAIRARLEHYDMKQGELAEELGLSRARLHQLQTGTAQAFSLEALVRIAIDAGLTVRLSVTRPYAQD
ncbi:MAG: XRE family transcriptional regulator [Proteobacteria bacterium]|nr:XRE family transcriptional regulator [Pseudomonadota bacterium]